MTIEERIPQNNKKNENSKLRSETNKRSHDCPQFDKFFTGIDLFSGAGGATLGLKQSSVYVALAVEIDSKAAETYRINHPEVLLIQEDIRNLDPRECLIKTGLECFDIMNCCPPCQGFSTLHKGYCDSQRNDLVLEALRWIIGIKPRILILENVPGLVRDRRYDELIKGIEKLGYRHKHWLLNAYAVGVPQHRIRLILVATNDNEINLPLDISSQLPDNWQYELHASKMIEQICTLSNNEDSLHVFRKSTKLAKERMVAIPINGTRFDLPDVLQLKCHQRLKNRNATRSYSRVPTIGPCGTLTTRCTTPSCGPFVHPTEPRGLSLREAALLQTFPIDYHFIGNHESIERQIGNSMPPRMAKAIATILLRST